MDFAILVNSLALTITHPFHDTNLNQWNAMFYGNIYTNVMIW